MTGQFRRIESWKLNQRITRLLKMATKWGVHKMAPRQKRQRKNDRIASPGSTPDEIKIDFALGPFDAASREMDLKWGVDRLPDLVTEATANIWGATMANLNGAIQAQFDHEDQDQARADVIACVKSALKGFEFMDAEATRLGKPPASSEVFEFMADNGTAVGVMRDGAAWPAIKATRPDLVLYTMREVANALEAYGASGVVSEVKKRFPAAEIKKIEPTKPKFDANLGDQISF